MRRPPGVSSWRNGAAAATSDTASKSALSDGSAKPPSSVAPGSAYSPVEQGRLLDHLKLARVAERSGATPVQVALAWTLRQPGVIAIPKPGSVAHVRENREAADLVLSGDVLTELDAAFPRPRERRTLEML